MPVAATFPLGGVQVGSSPASFDGASLAVLAHGASGVAAHAFGEDLRCAERLMDHASRWVAVGRPGSQSLDLRFAPTSAPAPKEDGWMKIDSGWPTS